MVVKTKYSVQPKSINENKKFLLLKNLETIKVEEKKGKNHIWLKKYTIKELKFIFNIVNTLK